MPTRAKKSVSLDVTKDIDDRIYVVRGQRVMLDSDLAVVYQVETKALKRAVRRNVHRFPDDFLFELSLDETRHIESLRRQSGTLDESNRGRHSKYGAFAFTEHGAVMLASVLNSRTAVEASIEVVRAFVKMRTVLALHKDLARKIERLAQVAQDHENEFEVVWELLGDIMRDPKPLKGKIGFIEPERKKT